MGNDYYIRLIASAQERCEWSFKTLESRNAIYDKVLQKFKSKRSSQVPFIEVEIDNESNYLPTLQMPLRLNVESKDDVIKYIDSLV